MSEKKELNNEELDKVTGGANLTYYDDDEEYLKYEKLCPNLVENKYDVYKYEGQKVLLTYSKYEMEWDETRTKYEYWSYGKLEESFEKDVDCGTRRTARVTVTSASNKSSIGTTKEYSLDDWKVWVA